MSYREQMYVSTCVCMPICILGVRMRVPEWVFGCEKVRHWKQAAG